MNKSKVWGVMSTYVTVVLAIAGMFAYGYGTPSMSFLGVELTPLMFWGLMAILLAINIQLLYTAFSKKQSTQSAPERMHVGWAVVSSPLPSARTPMAYPATVRLFLAATVRGLFPSLQAQFNGADCGRLLMGQTLIMRTTQLHNQLMVARHGQARGAVASLTLNPDETRTLMLSYRGGTSTLITLPNTIHSDAKGRYRRVSRNHYAWTIGLTVVCLLGLVPLIKLYKAARVPDHAAAQLLIASALKWNLALTIPALAFVLLQAYGLVRSLS